VGQIAILTTISNFEFKNVSKSQVLSNTITGRWRIGFVLKRNSVYIAAIMHFSEHIYVHLVPVCPIQNNQYLFGAERIMSVM
jgi:hypothetical protein